MNIEKYNYLLILGGSINFFLSLLILGTTFKVISIDISEIIHVFTYIYLFNVTFVVFLLYFIRQDIQEMILCSTIFSLIFLCAGKKEINILLDESKKMIETYKRKIELDVGKQDIIHVYDNNNHRFSEKTEPVGVTKPDTDTPIEILCTQKLNNSELIYD